MADPAPPLKSIIVKAEIQLKTRAEDDLINARELQQFDLFRRLKKPVNVEKFPGSIVFRSYGKGEVVCRQGETEFSAFYIPTADDMVRWEALKLGEKEPQIPETEIPPETILTATILQGTASARRRGFWKSLVTKQESQPTTSIVAIPNDGPTDIDPHTRQANLVQGDVFGEMSCLTFAPRSATVVANCDCHLIEFNRNIFDQLQKDQNYREWMDKIYVSRVLESHLRRLEIFSGLSEEQLQQVRSAVTLDVVDPGTVICEEGEAPDGQPLDVLVIRSGVVQVVQNAGFSLREQDVDWKALCRQLIDSEANGPSPDSPDAPQAGPPPKPATASIIEAARKKSGTKKPADAGGKPKTADILAAARKKKLASKPTAAKKASPAKSSTADILAAARKTKGDSDDSESSAAGATSTADKLAAARGKSGGSSPIVQSDNPQPKSDQTKPSTADILAAARSKPPSAKPTVKPATADILKAARGKGTPSKNVAGDPKDEQPSHSDAPPQPAADDQASPAVPDSAEAPERPAAYLRSSIPKDVSSPQQAVFAWLSDDVKNSVRAVANGSEHAVAHQSIVNEALKQLTRSRGFLQMSHMEPLYRQANVARRIGTFPKGLKGIKKYWTDMEVRVAGRCLLSAIFPDAVRGPAETTRAPRVLSYLSRGECFGERSVVRNEPRSASCIAYDHPADGSGRKSGRVELVRIAGDVFHKLMQESPSLATRVQQLAATYETKVSEDEGDLNAAALMSSPEFQDLGLFQGTELLLIDLDACTRCGECVDACVATHDDGYSRLFLDGPRFGRFLVPSACRSCLNPACMIGCPVGSITRGGNGQIEIHDWCIGCGLCEQQCPYDSIQMHDLGLIPEQTVGWQFRLRPSQGESDDWTHSLAGSGKWATGISPFVWSNDFRQAVGVSSIDSPVGLCFRYEFANDRNQQASDQTRLLVTTPAEELTVWLNGEPVPLGQSPSQAKRGEWEATLDCRLLKRRKNVLAVELKPQQPLREQAPIFSTRLDLIPKAGERTESMLEGEYQASLELVKERAVVCDLCSSLPSQEPACVTSCPHTAAMRVNPLVRFPT